MDFPELHRWDLDPTAALALQRDLAGRVVDDTPLGHCMLIAGADVSYNRGDTELYAAVVVTRAGTFEVVERVAVRRPMTFPYVPGLLSFREAPGLLEAFRRLQTRPDVVLCDGQGIAHPRRFGVASHLGLWLGLPTVGCAKSWLYGQHDPPGPARGDRAPMLDRAGQVLGVALRTRDRVKPIYLSVGHRGDLASAIDLVLACAPRLRLPEPARRAHDYVNEVRRAAAGGNGPPGRSS